MKVMITAAGAFAIAAAAAADFAYDEYQTSTLKAVFALADSQCDKPKQLAVVAAKMAFRVRATWTGDIRSIDPAKLELLQIAEKSNAVRFAISMTDLFKREVRVTENGAGYWLPIQEPIVRYFEDEASGGKQATLFVMYVGCNTKQGNAVIVTLNEFDARAN
jgi:hypothetical protein